jgi:hypothetical protein
MSRRRSERHWAIALVALSACAYTSDYVPPSDGRARALVRDGEVVALIPAQPWCAEAVAMALHAGGLPPPEYAPTSPPIGYVGIDVPIVVEGGTGYGSPHAFPGTPRVHQAAPAGGPVHQAAPANSPSRPSGGHSGSSTSNLGRAPELLVVAAVVALVALPIVAIALATSSPGDSESTASAIDQVNAFNDLARVPGSACAPAPPAPPVAAPTAQGAATPAPSEPPPAAPPLIPPTPAPAAVVGP